MKRTEERSSAAKLSIDARLRALAKGHKIANRDALRDAFDCAVLAYDGARYWADDVRARDQLDKISAFLTEASHFLSLEINWLRLASALPDTVIARGKKSRGVSDRAAARGEWLYDRLEDLETIRLAARAAHQRPKRGRTKDDALASAVAILGSYWTNDLGRELKSHWQRVGPNRSRVPTSNNKCDQFVLDMIEIIDPKAAGGVEAALKQLISDRRQTLKNFRKRG